MKMNLFQSKRFVLTLTLTMCCVAFSVLILGLAIALNKAPNKANTSAQYIYGNNSIVKLEVTDDITLEDDTIEKLQPKIKVTSTGKQGEFGALVTVTPRNVIFDYTLDNTKHSFATMGKDITIDNGNDIGGGSGLTTITIPDKARLGNIRKEVNDGNPYKNCTIKLSKDLDLLGEAWIPIGTQANPFQGTFDGQKHTISNFNVTTASAGFYAGFFGVVTEGSIMNLNISNATVSASSFYTGILCGALASEGTNAFAKNCSVDSSCEIVADAGIFVGGMFGITSGATIEECSSNAQITLKSMSVTIGGLIGGSEYKVINCSSQANINIIEAKTSENEAECVIGGLVGQAGGVIDKCLFNGSINVVGSTTIKRFQVAGIVGNLNSVVSITNCVVDISNIEYKNLKFKDPVLNYYEESGGEIHNNNIKMNTGGTGSLVYAIHAGCYYTTKRQWYTTIIMVTITNTENGIDVALKSGSYWTYIDTHNVTGHQRDTYGKDEQVSVQITCSKNYYKGSNSNLTSGWGDFVDGVAG